MPPQFEELAFARTSLGELTLWRRKVLSLRDRIVYEIRLDGEFLMSSLINASEIALASGPLGRVAGDRLDLLIGGLGLGYTAQAALADSRVCLVEVVELLPEIIAWHRRGLVPLGAELTDDARCRLIHGDFYDFIASSERRYHAILLDIDHSPEYLLHPSHAAFYTRPGLEGVRAHLQPGGIFALWSADPIDRAFQALLMEIFADVSVEAVEFLNPLVGERDTNYICSASVSQPDVGKSRGSDRS